LQQDLDVLYAIVAAAAEGQCDLSAGVMQLRAVGAQAMQRDGSNNFEKS
jgi:hypothetical protein